MNLKKRIKEIEDKKGMNMDDEPVIINYIFEGTDGSREVQTIIIDPKANNKSKNSYRELGNE